MTLKLVPPEDCVDKSSTHGHKRYNKSKSKNPKKTRGNKKCFRCRTIDNGARGHGWVEYYDPYFKKVVKHYLCKKCKEAQLELSTNN